MQSKSPHDLPSSDTAFGNDPAAATRRIAFRALSAPVFVLGLEWTVSATNKILGNFVGAFPAYVSGLQTQHVFLPGLSVIAQFPAVAAKVAIATEAGLGIVLLLASFVFLRGANRFWESVGGVALSLSAIVGAGLWLMVGRPPFWPDPSSNGYGSGWPIEFFLVSISAALAASIAITAPEATLLMRVTRLLRRRHEASIDVSGIGGLGQGQP